MNVNLMGKVRKLRIADKITVKITVKYEGLTKKQSGNFLQIHIYRYIDIYI
jgi:hypothetical protein